MLGGPLGPGRYSFARLNLDKIFHKLTFVIPQLARFMRRATRFQALNFNEAGVDFDAFGVQVKLLSPTQNLNEKSVLRISCQELGPQISAVAQVFTSFIASIYMVKRLYIFGSLRMPSRQQNVVLNMQWLEMFQPFPAVKNLYLSKAFASRIALALQELIGGSVAEVLPTLQNVFLEMFQPSGPVQEAIGRFFAEREHLGLSVAIFDWNRTLEAVLHRF